ncbi:Ras-related protein Rab-8, partial [Geodia barretti]
YHVHPYNIDAPGDVKKVLIGNKCELESERVVSRARGEEYAAALEIPFLETSCKTNHNIKEAFEILVRQILFPHLSYRAFISDEKIQEIIDKALESQSLNIRNIVGIITGLMGSGKTWLLNRLFNQLPPRLYNSTGLAEQSLRSMLHHMIDVSSESWEPFSNNQILELLACVFQLPQPSVELPSSSVEPGASSPTTTSSDSANSPLSPHSTPRSSPEATNSSTVLPTDRNSVVTESPEMPKSSTMQSVVKHIKYSEKAKYPEILELVHMIDTGGQPELLENLPSLIHHCHLAILVLNLMFGLDEHPSITFHKEGKALKRVAPFQYSNRQIIQKLASTLQAKRFSKREGQCFRLLVVATHRDCVPIFRLSARVKAFDQALRAILLPSSKKELICFSADQIPFVLNLKKPTKQDRERLDLIRSVVIKSAVGEVVKTPASFLVFEQELMEFARQRNHSGILRVSECITIGSRLKMKPEDVEAALIFFHRQFSLLYFRHILPNLVFTKPQTPLDCINAVVKFSYEVGTGEVKGIAQELVSSIRDGIISEEILSHEQLAQCFVPDLYEPQHAIDLLSHTFTLAPLSRDVQSTVDVSPASSRKPTPPIEREKREYLMMSLQQPIPDKDILRHLPPPSAIAPLVVQFTNNCVPLSCFSRTISCLLATYDWKLTRADDGSPQCLSHNVVSLYMPQTPGQIVLVDAGHSFQVHISPGKGLHRNDMAMICYQVKETVFAAIKQVFDCLNLAGIEATPAFFCPCKGKPLYHS